MGEQESQKPVTRYDGLRSVLYDERLKMGARVLYQTLDDHAGVKGRCYPHEQKLAERLGAHRRSIQNWLYQLITTGHVIRRRTRLGNVYTLAWATLLPDAHGNVHPKTSHAQGDVHPNAHGDVRAQNRINEPLLNPQSSSSSPEPPTQQRASPDDCSGEEKKQAVRQTLLAFLERIGAPKPSGPMPDEGIAMMMDKKGASIADLEKFLTDDYAKHLKDPPATWIHVGRSVQNWLARIGQSQPQNDYDRAKAEFKAEMRRKGARNA